MTRLCEVCPAGANTLAGQTATYDEKLHTGFKFEFDVCAKHAAEALKGGAETTPID